MENHITTICPKNDGSKRWFVISEKEIEKLQIIHGRSAELIPTLATIGEQVLLNVMEREIEYAETANKDVNNGVNNPS